MSTQVLLAFIAACVLLGLLIIGATWYFYVSDQRTALEALKQTEEGQPVTVAPVVEGAARQQAKN